MQMALNDDTSLNANACAMAIRSHFTPGRGLLDWYVRLLRAVFDGPTIPDSEPQIQAEREDLDWNKATC